MITAIDERLRAEAAQHRLRWACEDCGHFEAEPPRCAFGFPTEPHRRARLASASELAFCKTFELG